MVDNIESMETVEVEQSPTFEGDTTEKHDHSIENPTEELLPKGTIIRGKDFNPTPEEIDLYGNIQLHHSVSHSNPDVTKVTKLLKEYPEGAEKQNQFGRLAIHYVVDRADASFAVAKLLLRTFPQGACVEDNEGNTPYDLALHWKHSKKMLRLILKYDKYQDIEMWRRLEYGIIYKMCFCFCCGQNRRSGISDVDGESNDEGDVSATLVKGQNSFEGYPENTIIPFSNS